MPTIAGHRAVQVFCDDEIVQESYHEYGTPVGLFLPRPEECKELEVKIK